MIAVPAAFVAAVCGKVAVRSEKVAMVMMNGPCCYVFLRMIAADSNDMRSPPMLLDCCGSMGRDGRCGLRQATEKRRSAYACNGRQNSRLTPTTNTLITQPR